MRPHANRQCVRPKRVRYRSTNRHSRSGTQRTEAARGQQVRVRLLLHHRTPIRLRRRRIDPRLQGHRRRQVQRRSVGHTHARARPVERQSGPEFPSRGPRRPVQRPHVPVPRQIRNRRPRALVERIRRHQIARLGVLCRSSQEPECHEDDERMAEVTERAPVALPRSREHDCRSHLPPKSAAPPGPPTPLSASPPRP